MLSYTEIMVFNANQLLILIVDVTQYWPMCGYQLLATAWLATVCCDCKLTIFDGLSTNTPDLQISTCTNTTECSKNVTRPDHFLLTFDIITSAKEVMFLPEFVCLSVCQQDNLSLIHI